MNRSATRPTPARAVIDTLHRWTGGLLGLLLATLGLSGTLLLWQDRWLAVPQTPGALDAVGIARLAERAQALGATSLTLPSVEVGAARIAIGRGAGAWLSPQGDVLARWNNVWQRPETFLFDLHHHLLAGREGETVAAIMGLVGLGFIVTGLILWWPTRRTFRLRALPARGTRPAILRHHRDLGAVVALPLAVSMLTGALIVLKPVSALLVDPLSPAAEVKAWDAKPEARGGPLPARPDWPAMLAAAGARFPDATPRVISLPKKPGDLVQLRLRQPAEWHDKGRTTLWFDPATARLVDARDAVAAPLAIRVRNALYPIHASKVGGLAWLLVQTVAGLALTLMGTLTMWSFWGLRRRPQRASMVAAAG